MNKKLFVKQSMVDGSIFPLILQFCLPLIAANLLQVAFNMADTVVVGLSSEPDAVGAVGTTTSFINLIVNLFIGCSVGAKVCCAHALGLGERKSVSDSVHTSAVLSILLGLLCAIVGTSVSRPVLVYMGVEGRLLELALLYTRIYFVGVPFVSVVNFLSALLHASGDTKTPMVILSVGGIVNVLLNLFFVLVCGMSVGGVALATILSNALCAVLLFVTLSRRTDAMRLEFRKLKLMREPFWKILRVGLPAGLQGVLFSISHLLIQASVLTVDHLLSPAGSAYAPVVKGVAACTGIEGFANIAVSSVGQAAVCIVGQNAGAHKWERVRKTRVLCAVTAAVVGVLVPGLPYFVQRPVVCTVWHS